MARKRGDDSVEMKILVKKDVEKKFHVYVDQNKFRTHGAAFEHMLIVASDAQRGNDNNEVETGDTGAGNEAVEKKGKGRKGKAGKGDTEDAPDKGLNGDGDEQEEGLVDVRGRGKSKRGSASPTKKSVAPKGIDAAGAGVLNGTFDVDVHPPETLQDNKSKSRKAAADGTGEGAQKNALEAGDTGDGAAGKPKGAQMDNDAPPEPKKRKGKAASADVNAQEPAPPTNRRGVKKMTSASSIGETAQGEGPKSGDEGGDKGAKKKKQTKALDAATTSAQDGPNPGGKPKRGRQTKVSKNYAEVDEDDL